jgi:hypothetical protein
MSVEVGQSQTVERAVEVEQEGLRATGGPTGAATGAAERGDEGPPPPMCELPGVNFFSTFFGAAQPEPEPSDAGAAPVPTELASDGQWEVDPPQVVLARAVELGLPAEPSEYESTEVLVTPKRKQIGRTQLGQVVHHYARAKAWAEECAAVGSGLATHRCTDLRCEECVGTAAESGTHACVDDAPWGVLLNVKAALWQGRNARAAWEASSDAPIAWDIPCSAHPALQKMYEMYAATVADELQPVGPAWDWLLNRPKERKFSHWSRQPLREEDKRMFYCLERTDFTAKGHENITFSSRMSYVFGKVRLLAATAGPLYCSRLVLVVAALPVALISLVRLARPAVATQQEDQKARARSQPEALF